MVYSERDTTSYLEVRGIKINDEAVYKCEITYLDVVESCLVVQFINLTTLSKFRRVRIISIVVNYLRVTTCEFRSTLLSHSKILKMPFNGI